MSTEFLVTALIVVIIPGTGVIYTISTGLSMGARASLAAAVGCTFGIVPHLLACVFGLAALLHASAVAYEIVKYAGVAYLFYLAYGIWKSAGYLELNPSNDRASLMQVAVRGTLINILNPKLSIFFLAFLPQFISPQATSPLSEMLYLSIVFMVLTLIVFIGYGLGAHGVRRHLIAQPGVMKWVQRGFAGIFVALAMKLALDER